MTDSARAERASRATDAARPEPRRDFTPRYSGSLTPEEALRRKIPREEQWFDSHGDRNPNSHYSTANQVSPLNFIF
jgi:hypothetical protein